MAPSAVDTPVSLTTAPSWHEQILEEPKLWLVAVGAILVVRWLLWCPFIAFQRHRRLQAFLKRYPYSIVLDNGTTSKNSIPQSTLNRLWLLVQGLGVSLLAGGADLSVGIVSVMMLAIFNGCAVVAFYGRNAFNYCKNVALLHVRDHFASLKGAMTPPPVPQHSVNELMSPAFTVESEVSTRKRAPTSVLKTKVPGSVQRRASHSRRNVIFSEKPDGSLDTAYYYYNSTNEPQRASKVPNEATPVKGIRRSLNERQTTPYTKRSSKHSSSDETTSSNENKENALVVHRPPLSVPIVRQSLSQRQALIPSISQQLRKRRLAQTSGENEQSPAKRPNHRRMPLTLTRSVSRVGRRPLAKRVREEREERIWREMNRKREKVDTSVAKTSGFANGLQSGQNTGGGALPTSIPGDSSSSTGSFQFGSAPTSTSLQSLASSDLGQPKAAPPTDTQQGSASFAFGSTKSHAGTQGPTTAPHAQIQLGAGSVGSQQATSIESKSSDSSTTAPQPSFAFGSAAANTAAAGTVAAPANAAAPKPSFAFGSTAENTPAPGPVAAPGNTVPQPSFSFGSTGGNTPAPGPVAATASSFQFGATTSQSNPGGSTAMPLPSTAAPPNFGFGGAAPNPPALLSAPSSLIGAGGGVPPPPALTVGVNIANNNGASARRRAARSRRR